MLDEKLFAEFEKAYEETNQGYIELDYFLNYIAGDFESHVRFNQTWLVYVYHSYCSSKRCRLLNNAYDYMWNDQQDLRKIIKNFGEKAKQEDEKTPVHPDSVRLGRINCRVFRSDICDRIVKSD